MFILPNYPNTTKFLDMEERAIATRRMQPSGSMDTKKGGLLNGLRMATTDYKVWLLA